MLIGILYDGLPDEMCNNFGGSAENYISDEDYQKGVDGIKNLAKEYTGSFNNNKYLKWLIGNSGDINITDYISENANQVDFSNFNLKELPDMSMFDNITKVIATNSGLYKFPNGNQLPKNIKNLSISNNGITDFTFDGFPSLNNLEVIFSILS